MRILFKKLYEAAVIPTRADKGSAGYDLYVPNSNEHHYSIQPGETYLCKLGFATEFPDICHLIGGHILGLQVEIRSRSGLAKRGLVVANSPGTVDSSYRNEWGVLLHNQSDHPIDIHPSDRIAQAVMVPYISMEFEETDQELSKTDRDGGFGHSGR